MLNISFELIITIFLFIVSICLLIPIIHKLSKWNKEYNKFRVNFEEKDTNYVKTGRIIIIIALLSLSISILGYSRILTGFEFLFLSIIGITVCIYVIYNLGYYNKTKKNIIDNFVYECIECKRYFQGSKEGQFKCPYCNNLLIKYN